MLNCFLFARCLYFFHVVNYESSNGAFNTCGSATLGHIYIASLTQPDSHAKWKRVWYTAHMRVVLACTPTGVQNKISGYLNYTTACINSMMLHWKHNYSCIPFAGWCNGKHPLILHPACSLGCRPEPLACGQCTRLSLPLGVHEGESLAARD